MRVARIGNINNNGYLITKFLRRKGVEADLYVYDYDYWMAAPEWEEGVFDLEIVPTQYPKWSWVPLQNNWKRPPWVKSVPPLTWHRLPYAKLDPFVNQMEQKLNSVLKQRQHRIVNESLRQRGLDELDFTQTSSNFDIYRWEAMVSGYDLVQVHGSDVVHILLDYSRKPYVIYDSGQVLRQMVWEESVRGRLLRAAYENADWIVVTNADTKESLDRLGIKNYSFIPAAVDETKFCPGESHLRKELEAQYGKDVVVLFAPARQDWKVKGNDKILHAFAKLRKTTRLRVILLAAQWGNDAQQARAYVEQNGLTSEVIWLRPVNRTKLVDYYRAADIVLDQFILGTYGGKAMLEAMACAKPLITYLDHRLHTWCLAEMPPVCSAQDSEGIYRWLIDLIHDPKLREEYGRKCREWIEKYNGWELVADAYISLYQILLKKLSG
jgi:glycosyltransferase involved in cell wall biosynthesis